ncbi:hypothetical protein BST16_13985 [Mycobacterium asiaticum DSM 44297]|nr:hypothetical protein BST16_13985 [Mycobacterium asiaticum DSM 44297]
MTAVDRIEVYCKESSHSEKRWRVGTFERHEGHAEWRIDAHLTRGGQQHTLIGNRRLPAVFLADGNEPDERVRYPLRCGRCDLSVPISEGSARMRRLQSALDQLARAGVSEISLSGLITIL